MLKRALPAHCATCATGSHAQVCGVLLLTMHPWNMFGSSYILMLHLMLLFMKVELRTSLLGGTWLTSVTIQRGVKYKLFLKKSHVLISDCDYEVNFL